MTLRVTFEIVPYGEEEAKYPLSTLNIHNDGTGRMGYDRYYGTLKPHPGKPVEFEGVNHDRRDGHLELTKKVIERLQQIEQDTPDTP